MPGDRIDPDQLRAFLALPDETRAIEFKAKYELGGQDNQKERDELAKDVIALLNTTGTHAEDYAYLIIGAGNKLREDGTREYFHVKPGAYNQESLIKIVNSTCVPDVMSIFYREVLLDDHKRYGIIILPPSPYIHALTRELSCKKASWRKNSVLLRSGDGTTLASQDQIQFTKRKKSSWSFRQQPPAPINGSQLPQAKASGLTHRFCRHRHEMTTNVHDEYALDLEPPIATAFDNINMLRKKRGLKQHYPATRFRLIREPQITEFGVELDLAPINFAYLAIFKEDGVDEQIRGYARDRLRETATRISERLYSNHPKFNALNESLLGVEIVLITKDNGTLLRKRGASVLLARSEWDVSYGGYCGVQHQDKGLTIELSQTAQHEMNREIGILSGDPRDIVFTGVHHNAKTGAVDVLGFWPIEAQTAQLVDLLADKYPWRYRVFDTTKRAVEDFVWDTSNMIIDFSAAAIVRFIGEITGSVPVSAKPFDLGTADVFLCSQAFVCLVRALEELGHSTAELQSVFPLFLSDEPKGSS